MAEQTCAHEDCDCIIQDGQGVTKGDETYCSRYCAKAESSANSEECECGHDECV
jgi:hypothetical protein